MSEQNPSGYDYVECARLAAAEAGVELLRAEMDGVIYNGCCERASLSYEKRRFPAGWSAGPLHRFRRCARRDRVAVAQPAHNTCIPNQSPKTPHLRSFCFP